MQTEKIQAIRDWPPCETLTELRAYLDTCGYYRRFVKDFSTIAAPLYALTKKGAKYKWTPECQRAFEALKLRLMSEPILALPIDKGTYILDTDASNYGLGAVLSQEQSGIERVIAYSSRSMSKPELRYDTTRKELLAIVNGLKQFRQYLTGRHFIIRIDHAALSWLRRTPEPMPQLARWLTFIEEFDYEIVHRDGKRHSNCDGLSRRPEPLSTSDTSAVESASKSTSSEQLDTVYHDTDTEPDRVTDSEQSDLEEQIPSARPVHLPDKEQAETELEPSVRESLAARQQSDPELGKLVRLRLQSAEQPALALLSTESESAKRLYNQWERLEVREGLVRRRVEAKPGEQPYSQLLVPRRSVQDVLRSCHEGMTGGHFGIRRTLGQVKRRFYWLTWKEDTIRFCKRCEPCNEYHRGKLRHTGPLQPVISGAPYER